MESGFFCIAKDILLFRQRYRLSGKMLGVGNQI